MGSLDGSLGGSGLGVKVEDLIQEKQSQED